MLYDTCHNFSGNQVQVARNGKKYEFLLLAKSVGKAAEGCPLYIIDKRMLLP